MESDPESHNQREDDEPCDQVKKVDLVSDNARVDKAGAIWKEQVSDGWLTPLHGAPCHTRSDHERDGCEPGTDQYRSYEPSVSLARCESNLKQTVRHR
jgi:hypothetical protein